MTFSFLSAPTTAGASDVKGVSLLGLGTQMKTYKAGARTDTQSSPLIGLLNRVVFNDGTNKQQFSQSDYNAPVVIRSRPSNNIFKVRLLSTSTAVATSGMAGSYILVLYFKHKC